ncbi:class I SAM-dependent methyltransferase [Rossellomorea marisflavi]|uniref:class I SAM-dependent methyltransferase n=1 Tax=Rossellomorea marisflavi TaxID=189381 RepID=UPI003D2F3EA3
MKKNLSTDEAIERWNEHAEAFTAGYTEEGDRSRRILLNPAIFSLLGNVEGTEILDAGCGEGYLSRLLERKGAHVAAVDYSTEMLKLAEAKTTESSGIRYHHGNCENLNFLDDRSFDKVVSNMVIQDLEDHTAALRECYRLLRDGGTLVFSILHPCFITPGSGWIRDEQGEKEAWRVSGYFLEGVYEQPFPEGAENKVVFYHRSLTTYTTAIRETGFMIEAMVEPRPSDELVREDKEYREDLIHPNFLVFKLRKGQRDVSWSPGL